MKLDKIFLSFDKKQLINALIKTLNHCTKIVKAQDMVKWNKPL